MHVNDDRVIQAGLLIRVVVIKLNCFIMFYKEESKYNANGLIICMKTL